MRIGNRIEWDLVPLGRKSDEEIALEIGCHVNTVERARRARNIRPFGRQERRTTSVVDWASARFGEEPDSVIAERLGVTVKTTTRKRQDLGIAAFVPPPEGALSVRCRWCGSKIGERCEGIDGAPVKTHDVREATARGAPPEEIAAILAAATAQMRKG